MKKLSMIALCVAAVSFGASAQMSVVKEAESATKGLTPDCPKALKLIKPALENPETKGLAQTWFVAGKAAYGTFDKMFVNRTLGQEVDNQQMGNAIIDGYEYMMTALPLDTIREEKNGKEKIKTKYSKDIVKTIAENLNNYNIAATLLYEAKDYNGAYKAWDIFLTVPGDPRLGKAAPALLADSTFADIRFNQGIAAWQAEDLPKALESFQKAIKAGYDKQAVYDYAISVAAQQGKNDVVYELCEQALPLFGNQDPKFLQILINQHILNKEYDIAQAKLKDALAKDPNNSQYYLLLGVMLDEQKIDADEAINNFRQAVKLDPKNQGAQYYLGKSLCEKAYALADAASQGSQRDYEKVFNDQIKPLFLDAIDHLEAGYNADPDSDLARDCLTYLRNAYYNIHDEANMTRVEKLLGR